MAEATIHTVRAMIKGIDQAPRKVSLVAALVRGRSVADAEVILDHTPKRAALTVKKAIKSAAANAVENHGLDARSLQITTLSVTAGSRMRRYKPASRGRALPFEKKSSHILRIRECTHLVDPPCLRLSISMCDRSNSNTRTWSANAPMMQQIIYFPDRYIGMRREHSAGILYKECTILHPTRSCWPIFTK